MVDDRSSLVYLLRAFSLACCMLFASDVRAEDVAAPPVPSIAEVAPSSYGAGAELTVKGTGFQEGDQLRIGAMSLEILETKPEWVRAKVPVTLKRGGPLKLVRTKKPVASFDQLAFVPAPVLNAGTPAYAMVGKTVTLRGRNLGEVSDLKVGDKVVAIATKSPQSITFVVPEGLQTGAVTVSSTGGTASLRKPYEVYYPPTVQSVTPERFAAGMTLEVKGKHFAEGDRVSLGGPAVKGVTITPTRIQIPVPQKLMRGGPITITRRGKPPVKFEGLTFVPAPKLMSVKPLYASPGATVTLRGTGLATIDSLKIGDVSIPIASQVDRMITFVVPEKAATGALLVKSLGGEATLKKPYEIHYPPVVHEVTPKQFSPGATLRVTGKHLAVIDTAKLCNAKLALTVVDDGTLQLAVPAQARKCTSLSLSQRQRSMLKVDGLELVIVPAIELATVTPTLSTPGVLEVTGKGLDRVQKWSIGELVLSPDPSRAKDASATQQWLRVEIPRKAKGPLVAEAFGRTVASASEVELTVSTAQVTAARFAASKAGASGVLRGIGFTADTTFELDGAELKTKLVDSSQASFKLDKVPAAGKHRIVAVTGGARGPAYELDGDAVGYRFRAADVSKLIEGKLPKYSLDEIQLDLEQSSVVFDKPAGDGAAALKSIAAKATSRRDVAKALGALTVELARLAVAQRALCAAMAKGQASAAENARAGALLARASKQVERLLSTGVRPLWSGLPADALTDKASAKDLELSEIDQRLGDLIATRTRLADECADRYHAAESGKLVGRAWETIDTGIEREYETLVEQSLSKVLKAGKDRKAGEKKAKDALEHAFTSGRRAFAEKRLARVLEATKGPDKPTGKGAVTTKRADKVGKK